MQDKADSQLSYGLEEWPPLGKSLLFGLQWAAIAIPSIIILGHVVACLSSLSLPVTRLSEKLFVLTAVTILVQVLWGHGCP